VTFNSTFFHSCSPTNNHIYSERKFDFCAMWITNNIPDFTGPRRSAYSWQRNPSAQVGPPSFQGPIGGPLCAPVQVERCVFTWQFNLQSRARTFRGEGCPLSWLKRVEKTVYDIHDRIFNHHCSFKKVVKFFNNSINTKYFNKWRIYVGNNYVVLLNILFFSTRIKLNCQR